MKCFFKPDGTQIVPLENIAQVSAMNKTIRVRYLPRFAGISGQVIEIDCDTRKERESYMERIFEILSSDEEKK